MISHIVLLLYVAVVHVCECLNKQNKQLWKSFDNVYVKMNKDKAAMCILLFDEFKREKLRYESYVMFTLKCIIVLSFMVGKDKS